MFNERCLKQRLLFKYTLINLFPPVNLSGITGAQPAISHTSHNLRHFYIVLGIHFFHVNFAKDNICKYFPVVYLSPTLLDFVASRSPFKQDVKSAQSPVTDDQLELIEFYLVVLLSLHFELFLKYKYNSQLVNKQSI